MSRSNRFDAWAREDDGPGSLMAAALTSALAGVRVLAWLLELAVAAGGGS